MDGEPSYPVEYVVIDVQTDRVGGAAQFAWDAAARPLRRGRPLPRRLSPTRGRDAPRD